MTMTMSGKRSCILENKTFCTPMSFHMCVSLFYLEGEIHRAGYIAIPPDVDQCVPWSRGFEALFPRLRYQVTCDTKDHPKLFGHVIGFHTVDAGKVCSWNQVREQLGYIQERCRAWTLEGRRPE